MTIDTGLSVRYDADFPRAGVPQGTQQFRDNFRAIEEAIANLQTLTSAQDAMFDVAAQAGSDGAIRLAIDFAHNAFALPSGEPGTDPRPGMIRYADGTIEVHTGSSWCAVGGGSADRLSVPRTIALDGAASGSVSFDGSGDVVIDTVLAPTGVRPGNYGSASRAAILTVDAAGRLVAAEEVAIACPPREYHQTVPAACWEITHALAGFPMVSVVDDTGVGVTPWCRTPSPALSASSFLPPSWAPQGWCEPDRRDADPVSVQAVIARKVATAGIAPR